MRARSASRRRLARFSLAKPRPSLGRGALAITAAAAASLLLGACGSQEISVSKDSPDYTGAVLFSQRCAGCHTLTPAGTQGSDARNVRAEGPNLDQRSESRAQVLFAIRNGGFSGSIMPQNVVTGHQADEVAAFVSKYAGEQSVSSPRPGQSTTGQ